MSDLIRFSVSIEEVLLKKFDALVKKKKYSNRSEAFRDLLRKDLINEEQKENREIAGAITIVYDHHKENLLSKLTEIQHTYQKLVLANLHIHIDHNNCLEIIAVQGRAEKIKELSDTLAAIKGVKHGTLSMSTLGKTI